MQRKTRIMCTIGPSCADPQVLDRMLESGMDSTRINLSHGDRGSHLAYFRLIREAADRAGRPVPVLGDLQGPRLRVGEVPGSGLELEAGQRIVLSPLDEPASGGRIGTTCLTLAADLAPGDPVLIDDGTLRLTVEEVRKGEVFCRVEAGGKLFSRKGINLPRTVVSGPALTARDREDLAFMIEQGFDSVALSFVQSAAAVRELRGILTLAGARMQLVAKIERPRALADLEGILAAADGVLVARGDLGVELGLERVPAAQRQVLRAAQKAGVLSLVATHFLASMTGNASPTRAEVSDLANAVYDRAGVILFTGETARGRRPAEVVAAADRIIREAERARESWE